MASRGSNKYLSVQHEEHIASLFKGDRSPSSGAAEGDSGDVRRPSFLIECKCTRTATPKWVADFEKIAREAWETGATPMLALRYYKPYNVLAGHNGWIDFTIMLASDQAALTSQESCPYTSDNTCAHR